jgi:hypothetical protein
LAARIDFAAYEDGLSSPAVTSTSRDKPCIISTERALHGSDRIGQHKGRRNREHDGARSRSIKQRRKHPDRKDHLRSNAAGPRRLCSHPFRDLDHRRPTATDRFRILPNPASTKAPEPARLARCGVAIAPTMPAVVLSSGR